MSTIVLDMGHTGHTGGRPGATHGALSEASIVRRYVCRAADVLEAAGHTVEIIGAGAYSSRQSYSSGASAYVACHVNAGWKPGYRGAVFTLPTGGGLAAELATEIEALTGSSRVWDVMRAGWTRHAWALIASALCPAVVYEPVFIDCPAHLDLCQAPDQIGEALAAGLIAYLRQS